MGYETLETERQEAVFCVTLQRPKALNALNRKVLQELDHALGTFEKDPQSRVCVLTGAGDRAFVAGADIAEMVGLTPLEAQAFCRLGQEVFLRIESIEKPVLAAVNGFALGGGCELALACDLIYASEKAQFGQPEINIGIIPGFGGTQRLPKAAGRWRAKEWIYLGEMVSAQRALEIGLVNRVFPPEKLLEEVLAIAHKLSAKPPVALAQAKKAIQTGLAIDIPSGCVLEREAFAVTFATADRAEGMRAFLEKRKADFQGK